MESDLHPPTLDYNGVAGGFGGMLENPSQFQSSPTKNRSGGGLPSQSLKTVTIKQLREATLTHPDNPYQVDGHDISQVTLVACLRTLKEQNNGSDYLLEDGTGTICGHLWANDKNGGAEWTRTVREGEWVRVYGVLKTMNANRYLQVNSMRKVEDGNELTFHFLNTIVAHLLNTGYNAKSTTGHTSTTIPVAAYGADKSLSAIHQACQALYRQCTSPSGLHVHSVVQALRGRYTETDVRSAVLWLMNEGYLYQTIDNDHAKSTD